MKEPLRKAKQTYFLHCKHLLNVKQYRETPAANTNIFFVQGSLDPPAKHKLWVPPAEVIGSRSSKALLGLSFMARAARLVEAQFLDPLRANNLNLLLLYIVEHVAQAARHRLGPLWLHRFPEPRPALLGLLAQLAHDKPCHLLRQRAIFLVLHDRLSQKWRIRRLTSL